MTEMWQSNPKVHGDSEKCLPKTKQNSNRQDKIIGNKEKTAELLCDINSSTWQWMLVNFYTDEEETSGNRDVVL